MTARTGGGGERVGLGEAHRSTLAVAIADEPVQAVFRSSTSPGALLEEDGELWRRDGVLLAQSRPLALLLADRR